MGFKKVDCIAERNKAIEDKEIKTYIEEFDNEYKIKEDMKMVRIVNYQGNEGIFMTREVYLSLIKDSEMLSCLRAVGVDNWEGYSEAVKIYENAEEE